MTGWRELVDRALSAGMSGPVHLNVAMREPLVPEWDPTWSEPLDEEIERQRRTPPAAVIPPLDAGARTVVVAGDRAGPIPRALAETAAGRCSPSRAPARAPAPTRSRPTGCC